MNLLRWVALTLFLLGSVAVRGQSVWSGSPEADTFLSANASASNFGGAGALMVAGSLSGRGEFVSLLRFPLAAARAQFDLAYGSGNWSITGVSLRLAGNVGVQGAGAGNPIFPNINTGNFSIFWLADDTWAEGTGTPASPAATGVKFDDLSTITTAGTALLGNFTYVPPGNNTATNWALGLSSSDFTSDLLGGSAASFRISPGDTTVAYLFNSRTFGTVANRPVLEISAVPEPAVFSLLAVCGFAFLAWRRKLS